MSQQPPPGTPFGAPSAPRNDERTLAILAHLSPVIAMVLSVGSLTILGPLIIWFGWRERGELVRNAAASSFNFTITVWVATVAAWICFATIVLIPVAIVLWAGAGILQIVLSIVGAMAANRGEIYRYPLQVPILK